MFDQGGVSGQLLIKKMVLGVEESGLGGRCLADRHCSSFLTCYLGTENVEAAGKSFIALIFGMFYALFVVAVDGICEPGMLAVGFIVVVGLLFICCCCYCGCCFLGRRRRGRLNLLEDL